MLSDFPADIESIDTRQHQIEQDQVKLLDSDAFKRFGSVARSRYLMMGIFQKILS